MPRVRRFSATAWLLILALIGNLGGSLSPRTPAQTDLAAAQSALTSLLGPGLAFCTPGMADDGSGGPGRHALADCILCCLPTPLRLAVQAQSPLLPLPKPVHRQAPWPPLTADWHDPDPAPPPYRPRDPPAFA